MKITQEGDKTIIRCSKCNFMIYDGMALRMRIGLIRVGRICIKCKQCGSFNESIPISIFLFNKT